MDPFTAWLFCIACTVAFAFLATIGPRYEWTRRMLRRMYTNPAFPLILRAGVGVHPILAVASGAVAIAFVLPRPIAQWLLLVFLDLVGFGMLLTYRTPPPFTPEFLRREIASGIVPLQRPAGPDWLVLAFIVLVGVMVNLSLPLLILGNSGS